MKLRQKLAAVMAAAMVVTSVPVVTMGASTATASKVVSTADTTNALGSTAPIVKVELKDDLKVNQFYISLEGAEWAKNGSDWAQTEVTTGAGIKIGTITPSSKTEAVVTIDDLNNAKADTSILFSLENAIVKEDKAYVVIDGEGTEVTSDKVLFATKNTAKAKVTSKNDQTFYTTKGSAISDITVEESVVGTFKEEHKIVIDLENSDYEFITGTAAEGKVVVTGTRGIATSVTPTKVEITSDRVEITLPAATNTSRGGYKIAGIEVKSVDKEPATGDLNVTVSGEKVADGTETVETTTLAVAEVAEYGTQLTVKEKKDVVAGKEATVEVTLKETTADSIAKGDVEFTLSEGVMMEKPVIDGVNPDDITLVAKDKKDLTKGYTGFIVEFGGKSAVDELVAKIKVQTEIAAKGEVSVSVEGRFVEEQSVVVAEVTPNFSVKTEAMTLKVGQSKQVGGKLAITETEAGTFKRGTTFEIEVAKEDGITLTELPEVSATNGMTVKADWKKGSTTATSAVIVVEVTKASKDAAAEITIENFEAKVDRTVAEGAYDLTLKVEDLEGEVEVKDFLVIGTPNTEDLASNGLVKGTSTFVIGESKYTVNGVEKTMDAQSFIQNPGYTMVPMRYVAEAFGVKGNDILFSKGVTTIFAGTRTIQLTNGSDVALVNGVQIKMATKVVIKDGRTYAPIGEVAQLLGIGKSWDNATKTATFTNK